MKLAATLVALPYGHASGSTPAAKEDYRCFHCPAGSPLHYRVFPRMEASFVAGGSAHVIAASQVSDGSFHVEVHQVESAIRPGGSFSFPVFYDLDSHFNPIRAQFASNYEEHLRHLRERGILSRPLIKNPDDELFPILAWDGKTVSPLRRPASQEARHQAQRPKRPHPYRPRSAIICGWCWTRMSISPP